MLVLTQFIAMSWLSFLLVRFLRCFLTPTSFASCLDSVDASLLLLSTPFKIEFINCDDVFLWFRSRADVFFEADVAVLEVGCGEDSASRSFSMTSSSTLHIPPPPLAPPPLLLWPFELDGDEDASDIDEGGELELSAVVVLSFLLGFTSVFLSRHSTATTKSESASSCLITAWWL